MQNVISYRRNSSSLASSCSGALKLKAGLVLMTVTRKMVHRLNHLGTHKYELPLTS